MVVSIPEKASVIIQCEMSAYRPLIIMRLALHCLSAGVALGVLLGVRYTLL